ncbi:MAG: class I SAM-dependent methyltransferase [Treponema sp.]|jgi:ubiquinone/menaquinone biosynthesis C-methylase UbiE|nr:class I SAM-dependent methyltransferase [Treponema sp.]
MDVLREEMQSRWNTDGVHYDEIPAHGIQDKQERLPWTTLFSSVPQRETKVLDVGTGTGFVALLAAEQGLAVTGLDWSETMLSQAREKAAVRRLKVQWVQGFTETIPFQDNTFSLLCARHVLWTLAEPVRAFREWWRVLQPGGKAYADYAPRTEDQHIGHHYSEETERKLPLNRAVSAEAVMALFHEAGFGDVSVSQEQESCHGDPVYPKRVFMFTCVK